MRVSLERFDPTCALVNRSWIIVRIKETRLFGVQNSIIAYVLLCVYHYLC